jgi:hypothetical protein
VTHLLASSTGRPPRRRRPPPTTDERDEKDGIESHIDAIDIDHDRIVDLRGWVRTYAGTNTVIYVGIYTALKLDGVGYVSVGFPLPNANLTATLIPANVDQGGLLLRTKAKAARYVGDYIVVVDERSGDLSVFRIRGRERHASRAEARRERCLPGQLGRARGR